jgi:hypothetical protein
LVALLASSDSTPAQLLLERHNHNHGRGLLLWGFDLSLQRSHFALQLTFLLLADAVPPWPVPHQAVQSIQFHWRLLCRDIIFSFFFHSENASLPARQKTPTSSTPSLLSTLLKTPSERNLESTPRHWVMPSKRNLESTPRHWHWVVAWSSSCARRASRRTRRSRATR